MKSGYTLARTFSIIVITTWSFLVAVMLANLNPKANAKKADEGIDPPGNFIVHIVWPDGDTDIDLWVDGPGEKLAIGYSNKSGVLWDLLRDDLGNGTDNTPINYEDAFTRGVAPGEYTINVHCYRCPRVPQKVTGSVQFRDPKKSGKEGLATVVNFVGELKLDKQEITLVRYKVGSDGKVIPNSFNKVYRDVRSRPPLEKFAYEKKSAYP